MRALRLKQPSVLPGFGLTLDDLKNFRQLGSPTAGHPERGDAAGIETTTGPLGQGIGNAVGFAVAEAHLAATFNREGHGILDGVPSPFEAGRYHSLVVLRAKLAVGRQRREGAAKLREALAQIPLNLPSVPVISNVTAQPHHTAGEIHAKISCQ